MEGYSWHANSRKYSKCSSSLLSAEMTREYSNVTTFGNREKPFGIGVQIEPCPRFPFLIRGRAFPTGHGEFGILLREINDRGHGVPLMCHVCAPCLRIVFVPGVNEDHSIGKKGIRFGVIREDCLNGFLVLGGI